MYVRRRRRGTRLRVKKGHVASHTTRGTHDASANLAAMKRSVSDVPTSGDYEALAANDFSTLSVYSYKNPVAAVFLKPEEAVGKAHAILSCLFGPRKNAMFSVTRSSGGTFVVFDEAVAASFLGGPPPPGETWRVLYIHEGSEERSGSEISGALSALCAKLADAAVPVLNVCTLARNFMLVREAVSERALATLRATVEASHAGTAEATASLVAPAGVALRLTRPRYAICTLKLEQLHTLSHALLQLFFFFEEARRVLCATLPARGRT